MEPSQREQEEQMIMDMIAQNANNEVLDHREADSYLNMTGDGQQEEPVVQESNNGQQEQEEQPIAQESNDGQQEEV